MAFDIIDDGSTTYPNQSNIKLNLIKLTDYKSDNVKSKTIKIYKNNTLLLLKQQIIMEVFLFLIIWMLEHKIIL